MRKKVEPKTSPVRLTGDAIQWARIASGYTGESMAEYASRVLAENAKRDIERLSPRVMKKRPGRKGASVLGEGGSA